MAEIYIALIDTPGIFAFMIRHYLKQKYIHVAVSVDGRLDEAYSVGRRSPFVPVIAGFEREEKEKIVRAFPDAEYKIYRLSVTDGQKERLKNRLRDDYGRRFSIHYAVLGLPFLVCGKKFYHENHYTCSSYLAKILEDDGIRLFDKHFSLVTPKDFYECPMLLPVFEGRLDALIAAGRKLELAYE